MREHTQSLVSDSHSAKANLLQRTYRGFIMLGKGSESYYVKTTLLIDWANAIIPLNILMLRHRYISREVLS